MVSAGRGNLEIVKLLLDKGAILEQIDETGKSSLDYAVINAYYSTSKFLI